MTEKPLSEVADFLEMFVPEVKVPESLQDKSGKNIIFQCSSILFI
jgi:hypothetical protein